jgi:dipeptide transport system ATP-binding protein
MNQILDIKNLSVDFDGFKAVLDVDLSLDKGKVLGIVGESGSGKSVTQLALMGLIPYPGIIRADRMIFNDHDLIAMSKKKKRQITGKEIAMIFQEPMSSLNPCFTVEFQLTETLKIHEGGSRRQRRERAVELLKQVGIPAPEDRMKSFPHQLSGGISQRVMIAMAIACSPKLLIADEPTTALDVTIQAQILDLLISLQREKNMALILITHDMAVIAETVEDVVVMYAGQVVEKNTAHNIFTAPRHPYTDALLRSLPERNINSKRLPTIPGVVPGKYDKPSGCLFHPRCRFAKEKCSTLRPALTKQDDGAYRCHFPLINGVPQYE